MKKTTGQIIIEKREALGLSGPKLGDKVGVSKSTISFWENDHHEPKGKNLTKLCSVLGITAEQLFSLPPRKTRQQDGEGNAEEVTIAKRIPLISWISAGAWCESPDEFAPGDAEDWLPLPNNASEHSFALRVDGDSMTAKEPGAPRSYPHGTIIYVDPEKEATNGARVVARAPNGAYTFKTYFEDAGRMYLKAINTDYPPIDVTDNLHICGVVIGSYLPE